MKVGQSVQFGEDIVQHFADLHVRRSVVWLLLQRIGQTAGFRLLLLQLRILLLQIFLNFTRKSTRNHPIIMSVASNRYKT